MVKIKQLFSTYIWLLDIIYRSGPISLKEINARWVLSDLSGKMPLSRFTYYKMLDAIEDTFGVKIVCDFRNENRYSIADYKSLTKNTMARWLLSTMSVAGVVREAKQLQDRIILEQVPSGEMLLTEVTRAMQHNVTLKIRYRKFIDAEAYETELEPYCLKLFRQRWYLLAHRPERDYLAIYALDRMETAEETKTPFYLPKDFDANMHFENLFGVFQPQASNERPQLIRLRTYNGEWNYLNTLPLHASQKEVKRTNEYHDFTILVLPTYDLKIEILSRGKNIEVLEPQSLREDIKQMIKETLERYVKVED